MDRGARTCCRHCGGVVRVRVGDAEIQDWQGHYIIRNSRKTIVKILSVSKLERLTFWGDLLIMFLTRQPEDRAHLSARRK